MRSRAAVGSLLFLLLLLNGCITTTAKYVVRDAPVQPATKADKALVFVYRTSHRAPGSDIEVYAKGRLLGVLKGGTYFYFYAEPGSVSISAHLGGNSGAMSTSAKAGEAIYIKQDFTFMGIVSLEVVNPDEGRSTIEKLEYIELVDREGG